MILLAADVASRVGNMLKQANCDDTCARKVNIGGVRSAEHDGTTSTNVMDFEFVN